MRATKTELARRKSRTQNPDIGFRFSRFCLFILGPHSWWVHGPVGVFSTSRRRVRSAYCPKYYQPSPRVHHRALLRFLRDVSDDLCRPLRHCPSERHPQLCTSAVCLIVVLERRAPSLYRHRGGSECRSVMMLALPPMGWPASLAVYRDRFLQTAWMKARHSLAEDSGCLCPIPATRAFRRWRLTR